MYYTHKQYSIIMNLFIIRHDSIIKAKMLWVSAALKIFFKKTIHFF